MKVAPCQAEREAPRDSPPVQTPRAPSSAPLARLGLPTTRAPSKSRGAVGAATLIGRYALLLSPPTIPSMTSRHASESRRIMIRSTTFRSGSGSPRTPAMHALTQATQTGPPPRGTTPMAHSKMGATRCEAGLATHTPSARKQERQKRAPSGRLTTVGLTMDGTAVQSVSNRPR